MLRSLSVALTRFVSVQAESCGQSHASHTTTGTTPTGVWNCATRSEIPPLPTQTFLSVTKPRLARR